MLVFINTFNNKNNGSDIVPTSEIRQHRMRASYRQDRWRKSKYSKDSLSKLCVRERLIELTVLYLASGIITKLLVILWEGAFLQLDGVVQCIESRRNIVFSRWCGLRSILSGSLLRLHRGCLLFGPY